MSRIIDTYQRERYAEALRAAFIADIGQRVANDAKGLCHEIKAAKDRRSFVRGISYLRGEIGVIASVIEYSKKHDGQYAVKQSDVIDSMRDGLDRALAETRASFAIAYITTVQNDLSVCALRFKLWERHLRTSLDDLQDLEKSAV